MRDHRFWRSLLVVLRHSQVKRINYLVSAFQQKRMHLENYQWQWTGSYRIKLRALWSRQHNYVQLYSPASQWNLSIQRRHYENSSFVRIQEGHGKSMRASDGRPKIPLKRYITPSRPHHLYLHHTAPPLIIVFASLFRKGYSHRLQRVLKDGNSRLELDFAWGI